MDLRESEEISINAIKRLAEMTLPRVKEMELPFTDDMDMGGLGEMTIVVDKNLMLFTMGNKKFAYFYKDNRITKVFVHDDKDNIVAYRSYDEPRREDEG